MSGLGEKIAKLVAPEAVTITTQYVARLRASHDFYKKRCEFLEREVKRLQKALGRAQDRKHDAVQALKTKGPG